ncbi:MAG: hypothetical protein ACYCZV_16830 [Acidimicrobiales bacterium]
MAIQVARSQAPFTRSALATGWWTSDLYDYENATDLTASVVVASPHGWLRPGSPADTGGEPAQMTAPLGQQG